MLHDIFLSVMRVRATRGIRITNFYGNYLLRGTDLLALPNCTADSSFAVDLGYDEVKKQYICSNSFIFLIPILLHFILLPMNCPFLSFPISISISLTSSLSICLSLSPSFSSKCSKCCPPKLSPSRLLCYIQVLWVRDESGCTPWSSLSHR